MCSSLLKNDRHVIQLSFLSVLGFGQVCFVAGFTVYDDVSGVCAILALLAHFSCISSLAWLLSYVLFLCKELKSGSGSNDLHTSHFLLVGFGLPFLVVLIAAIWKNDEFLDSQ